MPLEIVRNDITKMKVDAIVNAANKSLLGGGGVDGAIHRAAGPELLSECSTLGGCETGQAKITGGYRLPAKYVIHTVGPVWHGGKHGEKEFLAACYRNSLNLALEHGCESVAFPLISSGAYRYPKDQAISVAIEEIGKFLFENEMTVYLVLFGHTAFAAGQKLFRGVQEFIDGVCVEEHTDFNRERERALLWQRKEPKAMLPSQAPMPPIQANVPEADDFLEEAMLPCDEEPDWEDMLKKTDESFSEALLRLIDEKGMTDAQCYKRANVDRKLFSKIRSNPAYKPSKNTVLAFAVALRLTLQETSDLLKKAGFALSHSSKLDIIVEYFITMQNYNVFEINEVLFHFDMPLLGSGLN